MIESDSEQLTDNLKKQKIRLSHAQEIVDNIEYVGFSSAEPLRLDVNGLQLLENYDRVGRVKAQLLNKAVPESTKEIESLGVMLSQPQDRFVGVMRLNVGIPGRPPMEFFSPEQLVKQERMKAQVQDQRLPLIVVDEAKKTIRINDVIHEYGNSANAVWQVVMHLLRAPNSNIAGEDIILIAKQSGSKAIHPSRDVIQQIRRKIEQDIKNPKLLTRSGSMNNPSYRLNAQKVVFINQESSEQSELDSAAPIEKNPEPDRILEINPEKREVSFLGLDQPFAITDETDWEVLNYLINNPNREIKADEESLKEIAKKAGFMIKESQVLRIADSLKYLQRQLREYGTFALIAVKDERRKLLVYTFPEDVVVKKLEPAENKTTQADDVWEYQPYVPTEEEKRSAEETRVLEVLVSGLLSHDRLWFDEVQRDLAILKRVDKVAGDQFKPHIYYANELKLVAEKSLSKLVREGSRPILRDQWNEMDEQLSNDVLRLMQKWHSTSTEQFLRKLRKEIETTEREYYNEHRDDEYYRMKHRED